MRHALHHLPAFLCLLIPLGIIAWLGSSEIRRQGDRTERAMLNHAASFARDAARQLEQYIHTRCALSLQGDIVLEEASLVDIAQGLNTEDPRILGLLVLSSKGELIYPHVPPSLARSIPYHRASSVPEISQGEQLEALGDVEGARLAFEAATQIRVKRGQGVRRDDRSRAHFALGGIYKRRGDFDTAEDHYLQALSMIAAQGQVLREGPAATSVTLMCELALACMHAERTEQHGETLDLMRRISGSEYDRVADGMLEAVIGSLSDLIPAVAPERTAANATLVTDGVRRVGRQFASEYDRFLRETVARRLNQHSGNGPVYQVYNSVDEASLIALRPARANETDRLGQGAWIGVRLDLELMLGEAVRPYLVPDEEGFYLDVRGPEGAPILSTAATETETAAELRFESPTIQTDIGLSLRAQLMDPQSYALARATSDSNRNLLALVLFLTAAGGAFLLVRSTARAEDLATMKIDFVSRVSHELKTPLALIKMYSETIGLGRTKDEAQRHKFAAIIAREADHLTAMIERVLDFSRQEAGTTHFSCEKTDLTELLNRVTEAYQPHVESRGGVLRATLEEGVVASVDADATERAVVNLLENAVKYTPADRDRCVELVLLRRGDKAIIEVSDRGVGIPEGEHEQIFSSFYRASNASEVRGAGLGLSLVSHFVTAHEGKITVRDRDGGGSTFRIELPGADETEPRTDTTRPVTRQSPETTA